MPRTVALTPAVISHGVWAAKGKLASGETGVPSGSFAGLLESGNIDLNARPRVKNADGSVSTVRSISANVDGNEVLLPTVGDDGKILTNAQAIDQFRNTGKHLGKFDTPENADTYAKALHEQQARRYLGGGLLDIAPARDTVGGLSGEYLKTATARAYARDGVWVTAPDESGLALIYKDQAVRRADGKPLVLTWAQLGTLGKENPAGRFLDDSFGKQGGMP